MVTHPVLVLQRDFALKTKWDRVTTIFPHIDGGSSGKMPSPFKSTMNFAIGG